MSTRTPFEQEAKGNSQMAYCTEVRVGGEIFHSDKSMQKAYWLRICILSSLCAILQLVCGVYYICVYFILSRIFEDHSA